MNYKSLMYGLFYIYMIFARAFRAVNLEENTSTGFTLYREFETAVLAYRNY